MDERLRFTGEWPPAALWDEYPNWEYALDEEGLEGQDETTLRPADNQDAIDADTAYTGGMALLADGRQLDALLGVFHDPESVEHVEVLVEDGVWGLWHDAGTGTWVSMVENWLPEAERRPAVSLDDDTVFPMRISSRLPLESTGKPFEFTVLLGGGTA